MKEFNEFDKVFEENLAVVGRAYDKFEDKLTDDEDKPLKISYTGLILDKESHKALVSAVEDLIPDNWELKAQHMTINMGDAKDQSIVGEKGKLIVKELGVDHNLGVIAVGVQSDIFSTNSKKHITVAVNTDAGAKPRMSNDIEDWIDAPKGLKDLKLTGVVEEVPFKNNQ